MHSYASFSSSDHQEDKELHILDLASGTLRSAYDIVLEQEEEDDHHGQHSLRGQMGALCTFQLL